MIFSGDFFGGFCRIAVRKAAWIGFAVLAMPAAGCRREIVPEPFRPANAHAAYTHSLVKAGLGHSALGQDWIAAASRALKNGVEIEMPYEEVLYIDPAQAFAVGYRFRSRAGRRVQAQIERQGDRPFRLFVDLFRLEEDGSDSAQHVASASALEQRLVFEPRGEFDYLLRVQSELLRGGRIRVTIEEEPSLKFPVVGRNTSSIGSLFGAARDAGRRKHHGVDIFAPRHTEVVASSKGRVTKVGESELGGLVIWIRDLERPIHHYYAHLQTQQVKTGDVVEPGQVIGTVGNSGNARTTPPHLHFGLYARGVGPLNPWEFLFDRAQKPPEPAVPLDLVGNWGRTAIESISLLDGPTPSAQAIQSVPPSTPVRIDGATSRLYRAVLPNGVTGFLLGTGVEPLEKPLRTAATEGEVSLLDRPSENGIEIRRTARTDRLAVLGQFKEYLFVSLADGRTAWTPAPGLDESHR